MANARLTPRTTAATTTSMESVITIMTVCYSLEPFAAQRRLVNTP